ncbi:C-terminal binding protein [Clostridiaceae bacterium UIB06]|uniref:C-terminal binding protein n=1 Tax=Clostridium thailandense TaxID=2794346 RepID=A0A949TZU5_9CLOT|nr:C-terminal binding protein [Clostridium thailandense]MBV7273629.1 C-terminal binding protein [Clostridium thailandense]MCH5137021.1 C-terminal binding protein [Clostridiaceae bacterium UIB06]
MKPLIWIIDEEWSDYVIEEEILKNSFPNCIIKHSGDDYEKDLEDFGKDADAILCQVYIDMSKKTIEKLNKCKIIAIYGGGYDRVDVEAAKEKGIKVTSVPGYCVEDISDYVIAAIFFLNKNLYFYIENSNKGLWGYQASKKIGKRINSSTLFIIGFGRIGRSIAEKAKAIKMNVMVYDPYVKEEVLKEYDVKQVDLETGLGNADYISINTIYCDETKALISKKEFKIMKNTAYIINASRGKVINERDMVEAVKNRTIAGAVLDVIENEPPCGNEEIFNCENIFVTPHVSYLSIESLEELKKRASGNVVKILNGEETSDIVQI